MKMHAYYFRIILIGSVLISNLSILSFGPGQRIAVQELTKAIKAHTISPTDARKKALSFKLTGTDLNDAIVRELLTVADSNGIQDILNTKLISAPAKPSPIVKPTEPSKPPKAIETLQAAPKVVESNTSIAVQKPELLVPARLPEATFNALKENLKILKKNYTTMSPQEIEQKIDEIKKGFGVVSIPAYMTAILTKIEKFKDDLAKDITAMNALSTQFMEQELKNKLTDPKIIKKFVGSMDNAKATINEIRTRYILNKSMQIAASNAWRALQNALYKVLQESMKQAAQLNDNTLLYKLIEKYFFVVHWYPFYSEKRLERLWRIAREDELKAELENIAQLMKEKKDAPIQKQIEEEKKQPVAKELNELLVPHSKTQPREEQNARILSNLEKNDYYMMIPPDAVEKQAALLDADLLTEAQDKLLDKIFSYQDDMFVEKEKLTIMDIEINNARNFIAQKLTDANKANADKAGEYVILLDQLLETCKERFKTARQDSWIAQQLAAKINVIKPLRKAIEDMWYKLEMTSSQQQILEEQTLDALTQATQPATAPLAPTPAPAPSKDDEFKAAVKKAHALIQDPITVEEIEAQSKELDRLYDYYKSQNMQDKIIEIKELIAKLDDIAKDLDEAERGIKEPTRVEFNKAIDNTIALMSENPGVDERWHKQHKELTRFSRFYEQELKAAKKEYNQNKMDQAQKKLTELRPYIEELSDKIVELEGSSEIITTPALKHLTKGKGL